MYGEQPTTVLTLTRDPTPAPSPFQALLPTVLLTHSNTHNKEELPV